METKKFFERCFLFHHFTLPCSIIYSDKKAIDKDQIPEILVDGLIKSHADLSILSSDTTFGRTIEKLDVAVGLNHFVYFTFGAPLANTGPYALIFAVPFSIILKSYEYPDAWVSWGDIFTHLDELFGILGLYRDDYNQEKLLYQYQQSIFLLEDVPEVASYFVLSHGGDKFSFLADRWLKKRSGYWGPEIKIKRRFPLKLISYCFIDHPESPAGRLAFALYNAKILPCKPLINTFFYQNRYEDFYNTFRCT